MKTYLKPSFFVLLLFLFAMILSLNNCKNLGPSEWPTPDPKVLNQFKISVLDSESGSELEGFDISIVQPDGSSLEFFNVKSDFSFDAAIEGQYQIIVTKDGFLSRDNIVEVEIGDSGFSTITHQLIFLNKRGNSNFVSPNGTTLLIETGHEIPTEIYFPPGALTNDQNITVTYLHPILKHGELEVIGERIVLGGYHFSPSLTFPDKAKPIITVPIDIPIVNEGNSDVWLGNYNESSGEWDKVEGVLNSTRTTATFEIMQLSKAHYIIAAVYIIQKQGVVNRGWIYEWGGVSACGGGIANSNYPYLEEMTQAHFELWKLGYKINIKRMFPIQGLSPKNNYIQWIDLYRQAVHYKVWKSVGGGGGYFFLGDVWSPHRVLRYPDMEGCHDQGGGK